MLEQQSARRTLPPDATHAAPFPPAPLSPPAAPPPAPAKLSSPPLASPPVVRPPLASARPPLASPPVVRPPLAPPPAARPPLAPARPPLAPPPAALPPPGLPPVAFAMPPLDCPPKAVPPRPSSGPPSSCSLLEQASAVTATSPNARATINCLIVKCLRGVVRWTMSRSGGRICIPVPARSFLGRSKSFVGRRDMEALRLGAPSKDHDETAISALAVLFALLALRRRSPRGCKPVARRGAPAVYARVRSKFALSGRAAADRRN